MKKILMATAILALGVVAYGVDKTASAPVRVRAEIVKGDLTISDIDGRPILLDFGKIAPSRTADANAFVDYKIEYSGSAYDIQNKTITLGLGTANNTSKVDEVTITNIDATLTEDNSMTAKLQLDTYTATAPKDKPTDGVIHTGRINGTLLANEWLDADGNSTKDDPVKAGVYEGQTQLTVTVSGS